MSAAFTVGLFFWFLQVVAAVGSELAEPQNVRMVGLNTNYIMKWDWDDALNQDVTFTTEYIADYKLNLKKKRGEWTRVCTNTSHRSCDLTGANLYYRGLYVVRVQANTNRSHSKWVQQRFGPDRHALVGPPSQVVLSPAGGGLDVHIYDPMTSANSSMKELLPELYYRIEYWEDFAGSPASGVHNLSSKVNLVTLSDLKSWTLYCVMVQSRINFKSSSRFSSPVCMQTEGGTVWWMICLYFLGSLVICFFIALAIIYGFFRTCRTFKATFFPSSQLPTHFREYLWGSPDSDIPHLLNMDPESELICDKVIICPEPVLEILNPLCDDGPAPPSGLEDDSSGHRSRQGSSSSRDSGVYSAEGSSSRLRQPCSGQTSVGAELPWQSPSDSEQVKMAVTAGGQQITDEGIGDMCV